MRARAREPATRSAREHREQAPANLRYGLLTVSDSRRQGDDETGDRIAEFLRAAGQEVVERRWVPDDVEEIREALAGWLRSESVDAALTAGGTGVSPRDVTPEAVRPLLTRELPGFGELFRALSWEEVGTAALASRALAGVAAGPSGAKLVFCLPGSPDACLLALDQLVVPEAGHLFSQANRVQPPGGRRHG